MSNSERFEVDAGRTKYMTLTQHATDGPGGFSQLHPPAFPDISKSDYPSAAICRSTLWCIHRFIFRSYRSGSCGTRLCKAVLTFPNHVLLRPLWRILRRSSVSWVYLRVSYQLEMPRKLLQGGTTSTASHQCKGGGEGSRLTLSRCLNLFPQAACFSPLKAGNRALCLVFHVTS